MRIISAVMVLLASFVAMSAHAADACYTHEEFEAEQGLRIHSELMVIGLTCAKMPGGQRLYSDYQSFTKKNQTLIARYEREIIDFFRKEGERHPEKKLHTLRTSLANKISQHAIKMSTSSFCRHFAPRIQKALTMDQRKIRKWARHIWPDSPTTQPVCTKS